MTHGWNWWLKTDSGLLARICIGVCIFAAWAVSDLLRRGRAATRWREYLFLLAAVAAGLAYGLFNDWIASGISWEFFYYGKGLESQLGPHVPPDAAALRWEAIKIGLKATWSAGLIVGVALLIANNPRPGRPQLSYRRLLLHLPVIGIAAVIGAAIGGLAGSRGFLTWTSSDLRDMAREDLFRPVRFMCVYGMNVGAYAGGLIATFVAVVSIVRLRRRLAALVT